MIWSIPFLIVLVIGIIVIKEKGKVKVKIRRKDGVVQSYWVNPDYLKKNYKVIEVNDYMKEGHPYSSYYRRIHVILEGENGEKIEIQLGLKGMNYLYDLSHFALYKDGMLTEEEKKKIEEMLEKYVKDIMHYEFDEEKKRIVWESLSKAFSNEKFRDMAREWLKVKGILKSGKGEALLGMGWEDVRMNIPDNKFRLVYIDMLSNRAEVIGDYDSLEEAKSCIEDSDELGKFESFVIYDDKGNLKYDTDWKEVSGDE